MFQVFCEKQMSLRDQKGNETAKHEENIISAGNFYKLSYEVTLGRGEKPLVLLHIYDLFTISSRYRVTQPYPPRA